MTQTASFPIITLADARRAHDAIPADKVNNNCVQDAQWRLRDALKLAERYPDINATAPAYVIKAVSDLRSWF